MCSQAISAKRRTGARSAAGFSLIELLIVVGIILIIASIAIPNYMKSRMVANEAAAVENIRTITTAETTYNISYGNGYAPTLLTLGGKPPVSCNNAALIDDVLAATALRIGYNFSYAAGPAVGAPPAGCAPGLNLYTVAAMPVVPGSTGQRGFCADPSAVIRTEPTGVAGNPGVGGCVDPGWPALR
ncbi:MAG: hypothetical protein AUH88_02630 [Acidobacteria bacterium 13_1_40CM_4_61_5]|nr:MAG: hypothetical protein AUH88_02630 [Acidobacteria bacterium 13_1_40CM_4_61_5]